MKTKLLICDFDGTLTKEDVLDKLCGLADAEEQSRDINERYINGEIGGADALRQRFRLIEGISCDTIYGMLSKISLTDGVKELFTYAREHGVKILIVSGNLDVVIEYFCGILGFDGYICSRVPIADGKIGSVDAEDVRLIKKRDDISEYMRKHGYLAEEVIAVGDSSSDLPIFGMVGSSFGINWKGEAANGVNMIDSLEEIIEYMV